MRPALPLSLNCAELLRLEEGYRMGTSHAYRTRCRLILLKSESRSVGEIAREVGFCEQVVHRWVARYRSEGIQGLQTRSGRGRKAILDPHTDQEKVRAAVQNSRQRLSVARAELEAELGREFSTRTLVRFVKKTVVAINASEDVPPKSQTRSFTP